MPHQSSVTGLTRPAIRAYDKRDVSTHLFKTNEKEGRGSRMTEHLTAFCTDNEMTRWLCRSVETVHSFGDVKTQGELRRIFTSQFLAADLALDP